MKARLFFAVPAIPKKARGFFLALTAVVALELALAACTALSARADDSNPFIIQREADQSLTILGPSCPEVSQQISAFRSWTARLGEVLAPAPVLVPSGAGCSARLNGSVPGLVSWFEGRTPARDGPNCWNTVLLANRMAQFSRYSSDFEFSTWMNSSYCQHLGLADLLVPGDTVAVRSFDLFGLPDGAVAGDDRRRETHAFVYVTDALAFSKNGLLASIPFQTQPLERIFKTYNLSAADQACQRAAWNVPATQCRVWAEAYRCLPPDRDIAIFEGDARWSDLLARARVTEQAVSASIFDTGSDESALAGLQNDVELLISQLQPFYEQLSASRASSAAEAKSFFFIQVTLNRLWSLRDQLSALLEALAPPEPRNDLPWAPGYGNADPLEYSVNGIEDGVFSRRNREPAW